MPAGGAHGSPGRDRNLHAGRNAARRLPWLVAAVGLIAIGGYLRVSAVLANLSVSTDEAGLARNIINRSFRELIQPLDAFQGAPLGYLASVKTVVLIGGASEYSLRALPLLTGLAALVMFWLVARRCLDSFDALLALAIFALCPALVYFSAQGKQYSTDVFVSTTLLYAALRANQALDDRSLATVAIVGALAIWLSHPAVFVLAPIGLLLAVTAIRTGRSRPLAATVGVGLVWLGSFALLYVLNLRSLSHNPVLREYWSASFAPHRLAAAVNWFWNSSWLTVLDQFGGRGEPAGYLLAWLFATGVIWLTIRRGTGALAWLVAGPLLFTLLASYGQLYPFGGDGGRLIVFAVPLFILGATAGWSMVATGRAWIVYPTLALAIFLPLAKLSIRQARGDVRAVRQGNELRPLLQLMRREARDGDHVYVFHGARQPYLFYATDFGYLSDRRLIVRDGNVSFFNNNTSVSDYEADLDPLKGTGRVWLVQANTAWRTIGDDELLLLAARRYGRELAQYPGTGAGVYLFDFDRADLPAGRPPDQSPTLRESNPVLGLGPGAGER